MQRLYWLVMCMALVGCGRSPSTDRIMYTQTVDGITIVLESSAAPVKVKPQTWTIRLTDAAGTPIDDALVYLDLVMPGMPMGQQKPLAMAQGSGRYVAEGFYTMDATWQVVVHAEIAGVDHQATFVIEVKPQQAGRETRTVWSTE